MNSWGLVNENGTAQTDNTAYTLRTFGACPSGNSPSANFVYAGTVICNVE